jgi:hypothetical protein
MHSKVFVKLKKTLKPSRPGKKTQKNPKKPKKPKKTQKNPKKPTGLGFFKKTRVFSNPGRLGGPHTGIQTAAAFLADNAVDVLKAVHDTGTVPPTTVGGRLLHGRRRGLAGGSRQGGRSGDTGIGLVGIPTMDKGPQCGEAAV